MPKTLSPMMFFLALFTTTLSHAFEWHGLLGKANNENKAFIGAFVVHNMSVFDDMMNKGIRRFVRPNVGFTTHSMFFTYFKNSNWDNTAAVGIERTWFKSIHGDHEFNVGYRAGALYGYCLTKEKYHGAVSIDNLFATYKCRENTVHVWRFFPMIFLEYTKGHVGFSINEAFAITTLNLFYRA